MVEVSLPQPVLYIISALKQGQFEAYIVGGAVRDTLMKRSTHDWDFTTNATPESIQAVFPHSFYDNRFGTVGIAGKSLFNQMKQAGWQVDDQYLEDPKWLEEIFEFTTYRTDHNYTDARRPEKVEWGQSIQEDLKRRDFTINAIAFDLDQDLNGLLAFGKKRPELELETNLVDPFDGQKDLNTKLIRAVGYPVKRFREDALRMMRAIRLGAQLGFTIETATLNAIAENANLINKISWERKRDELLKILASDYPADGLLLLHSSGLLEYLIPELLETQGVKQGGHHIYDVWKHSLESLRHCPSTDPIVRLSTLLHDIGKPKTMRLEGPRGVTFYGHEVVGARMAKAIGRRLRLSNDQIDKLFTLVRWHMFHYDPEMTDAAIRRLIRRIGLENINDMMLLRVGDRKGGGSKATSWRLRELQQRIGEQLYQPLSIRDLKITGHDVMETLNLEPGPNVGAILNILFEEIIEDPEKNSRDYLLDRIKQLKL